MNDVDAYSPTEVDPDHIEIRKCATPGCGRAGMLKQFMDDSKMIQIRKVGVGPRIGYWVDCDNQRDVRCKHDPATEPKRIKDSPKEAIESWNEEQKAREVRFKDVNAKKPEVK